MDSPGGTGINSPSTLIQVLSQTPAVLRHLLSEIPADRRDARRCEGQWSVKEWLCHLVDAQDVLMARFSQFDTEANPLIVDYQPPPQSDTRYQDRDFESAVVQFTNVRRASIRALQGYPEAFWNLSGRHESFSPYGTRILLSHMLNVDYAHLFAFEKLGLGTAAS